MNPNADHQPRELLVARITEFFNEALEGDISASGLLVMIHPVHAKEIDAQRYLKMSVAMARFHSWIPRAFGRSILKETDAIQLAEMAIAIENRLPVCDCQDRAAHGAACIDRLAALAAVMALKGVMGGA